MVYGKTIALIGGITNFVMVLFSLTTAKYEFASIWGVATCWAFASYFNELRVERKEKQIKNLEEILNKENEGTTVQN